MAHGKKTNGKGNYKMKYNQVFSAFIKESTFTKELLCQGVTQIRKANYASKGLYYQSFVLLSTGIERLCKLCLILEYYVRTQGSLSSDSEITNYGHKISKLFERCEQIRKDYKIKLRFTYKMDENIRQSIIDLLDDFSKTTGRYSNINILIGKEDNSVDCIDKWFDNVDMPLFEKHVSKSKKRKIQDRANYIGDMLNRFASVSYISENNTEITNAIEASRRTGEWEAVAPYRQLYLLQIIRYLVEILEDLGYKAMAVNPYDIPCFGEIFGLFYNDNSYFRTRKTWDKM